MSAPGYFRVASALHPPWVTPGVYPKNQKNSGVLPSPERQNDIAISPFEKRKEPGSSDHKNHLLHFPPSAHHRGHEGKGWIHPVSLHPSPNGCIFSPTHGNTASFTAPLSLSFCMMICYFEGVGIKCDP